MYLVPETHRNRDGRGLYSPSKLVFTNKPVKQNFGVGCEWETYFMTLLSFPNDFMTALVDKDVDDTISSRTLANCKTPEMLNLLGAGRLEQRLLSRKSSKSSNFSSHFKSVRGWDIVDFLTAISESHFNCCLRGRFLGEHSSWSLSWKEKNHLNYMQPCR